MIGKQIVALTLLSAMADQALAAPGHQHRQLHAVEKKRALEIEVVTKIVTVTVTYGAEPTKDDKGGIFVSVPDTTSTSVAAAPTVEQQVDNQKPASSSSSAQVQENAKRPSSSTSTSTAVVTTTAQPTTTAEPTTTAQPTTTAVPSSSSTSSAAPASTSSSSGGSGGSKRGIAYNDGTLTSKLTKCSWAYNWETQAKGGPSDKYIPTLKDASPEWITWFDDQVAKGVSLTSSSLNTVFSANEPDNGGQAGKTITSVAAAVQFQIDHFSQASNDVSDLIKKASVGAPSVTNGQGADQGLNYLKQWVEACNAAAGCRFDFCNLHWYDLMAAEDSLFSNLEKAHEICGGKPVWLTEFAALDENEQRIAEWLPGVLSKLDALDYVPRYAYFMAGNSQKVGWNLFNSDGSLNAIGAAYNS
ncbi:unnamed protein product [Clonostachys rosea f. rosea IK726]|uniref:Asl1-like glycosyl hydrolase catalytic domain-containing protein n=2 Tax=Bionectria ochroleuca TaxID=29856 RepID=A0A0B7JTI0_BIOOC|nr:unnamed protein product [Clonostachys rosea f. rosea IK726]